MALAALALCVTAPTANAQCELNFTVNPQLSTLSLGGGLVAPAAALVPTHPEAVLGLQGAAAGAAPGACPDSADALTRQLQGWLLGTTAELGPLELYPPTVQVRGQPREGCELMAAVWLPSSVPPLPACAHAPTARPPPAALPRRPPPAAWLRWSWWEWRSTFRPRP